MPESELPRLAAQVLWAAFLLAAVFGAIAQRTHFCTMGAVADIVNMNHDMAVAPNNGEGERK